ncbi:MAG: phosphoserine phosphatase SerB [Planctomycetota bacterium]
MPRSVIILAGPRLTDEHFRAVSTALAPQRMELANITPLSLHPEKRGVKHGGGHPRALDVAQGDAAVMAFEGEPLHPQAMPQAMLELHKLMGVDVNWMTQDAFLSDIKLAVFDMDSTLIQHEVIDELAIEMGKGVEVAAVTEKAMRGEIDFDTSLQYRVKVLAGLSESSLAKVAARLKLTPGAETLIATLKQRGVTTAILSGGFTYFAESVQHRLGLDFYHANKLEIADGALTGNVTPPIVNAQRKRDLLTEITRDLGLRPEQTLAVGDGANDLDMLAAAGLGVAYHAKPKVQQQADLRVNTQTLEGVLYLLGVHQSVWADGLGSPPKGRV